MKHAPDLDIFYLYTGSQFQGSRSQILYSALASHITRELIWLYLAINEIPWKRIEVPQKYAAEYRRQGKKATQLGALWKSLSRYCLEQPFQVWYARKNIHPQIEPSRSELQQWRESIWLRKKQLISSSLRSNKRPTVLSK